MIEIKRWDTGETIHKSEAGTLREAVEEAVREDKSLYRARLVGASLVGASLDRARLDGASLDDASLVGASLVGASLVGARLVGARLDGASLDRASLDEIRADIRAVLDVAPNEVEGLLALLRDGKVDGTVYEGECACLVGSIANLRHENHNNLSIALSPNASRPAETWALAIRRGDTPETSQVAKITEGWIVEWLAERAQRAGAATEATP